MLVCTAFKFKDSDKCDKDAWEAADSGWMEAEAEDGRDERRPTAFDIVLTPPDATAVATEEKGLFMVTGTSVHAVAVVCAKAAAAAASSRCRRIFANMLDDEDGPDPADEELPKEAEDLELNVDEDEDEDDISNPLNKGAPDVLRSRSATSVRR